MWKESEKFYTLTFGMTHVRNAKHTFGDPVQSSPTTIVSNDRAAPDMTSSSNAFNKKSVKRTPALGVNRWAKFENMF